MHVSGNRLTMAASRRVHLEQVRAIVRTQLAEIRRRRLELAARRRPARRTAPQAGTR